MSCEDCAEAWGGEPPCAECETPPVELSPATAAAWAAWSTVSRFARRGAGMSQDPGPLILGEVLALVEFLEGGGELLELVLAVEDEIGVDVRNKAINASKG